MLKTNPLLKMDNLGNLGSDFFHDVGLSDVSEHTEDTLDSSPPNSQKVNLFFLFIVMFNLVPIKFFS